MNRVLLLDNYDSFTHVLAQTRGGLGAEVVVRRNDADVQELVALRPDALVLSPGPGRPEESGVSLALLRALTGQVPILGVCLGHQCVVEAFGGVIERAGRLMHGKVSNVYHDSRTIY